MHAFKDTCIHTSLLLLVRFGECWEGHIKIMQQQLWSVKLG